jgi:formate dehydrogenase subunit gamma
MKTAVDRFDARARAAFDAHARTVVHEGEMVRHPVYTRVLHWSVAICFVLALLSGFAIYSAWLYRWLTPLFGGGAAARLLHPWFSLGFVVCFFFQLLNWYAPMTWTSDDRRWIRRVREYVANTERREPDYVDFLVTGVPMWFPKTFGRPIVAVAYVLHDVAGLVMLVGFIVHIYESTAAIPGTFQSMTRGTVERRWAWTHHPAWYRRATETARRESGPRF